MDDFGTGASASLNKTISDLMSFLGDYGPRPSPYDGGFREFLDQKISDVAVAAFKQGYKQAHRDCCDAYLQSSRFPASIVYEGRPRLAPHKIQFFTYESKVHI